MKGEREQGVEGNSKMFLIRAARRLYIPCTVMAKSLGRARFRVEDWKFGFVHI